MAIDPSHASFLREALLEGAAGVGLTHPNPAVGAVVVRGGEVVGRGWHRGPGTPHAEVEALRQAGERARGADLFVTLEPCCTWGRTPPCTDALLASGLARVFAASLDPNPAVAGKGIRKLREGGLDVVCPLLPEEGRALDPAYHCFYEKGRPFVHLKWAQTLDGCVSAPPGRRYLTGTEALARVHEDRFLADAILVSAGTAERDDPELSVRAPGREKPLTRIVLDRKGTWTPRGRLLDTCPGKGPLWLFRPEGGAPPASPLPEGVALFDLPREADGGLCMETLLGVLHSRKILRLYVEAVGALAWRFLRGRWVDLLSIHLVPELAGRATPAPPPPGVAEVSLAGATWTKNGEDWVVEKALEGRCLQA